MTHHLFDIRKLTATFLAAREEIERHDTIKGNCIIRAICEGSLHHGAPKIYWELATRKAGDASWESEVLKGPDLEQLIQEALYRYESDMRRAPLARSAPEEV